MRCAFCLQNRAEVWPTTGGKRGCADCLQGWVECCGCARFLEEHQALLWDEEHCYCKACSAKFPTCIWCNQPAVEQASCKDRPICIHCAEHFPQCDGCATLIHGDCTTYLQKVYCRRCADTYPLCLDCGSAIQGATDCACCGGPARVCAGCQSPFASRWLVYEGRFFCLPCFWVACGRCRFCQEEKEPGPDTRCQRCLEHRVFSLPVAQDLLDEVHWFCREELGLEVRQPYQLRLAETAADIPKLHTDAYTLSLSTVGLWAPRERIMWVVKGYPFWFTSAILAHEHAHAWQQENCPRQSQDLMEGFAAWVEWRVVKNLGYETFAHNMETLDCPIYGRGLRRCLALEKQVGSAGVLEKVKEMRSFSLWTTFRAFLQEI